MEIETRMNEQSETKQGPDVWQVLQIGLVIAFAYLVAAGPVFRMCARRQIPHACMAIYRPVMTPESPGFNMLRDYVAWWI
jgi:hypothetical protein